MSNSSSSSPSMMSPVNKNGFTLIEVLVAAVIIFATIATTTMIYSGAVQSSRKAEQALAISGYLPMLIEQIESELRQRDTGSGSRIQGNGQISRIQYQWQAELTDRTAPMARPDPLSGELIQQPARYRTWKVSATLSYMDKSQAFDFAVLTFPELP